MLCATGGGPWQGRLARLKMVAMIPARSAAAIILGLFLPSAAAAKVVEIGVYGEWRAFTEGAICYMGSEPKKAEGKYTSRDQPYVFVSHRPKDKSLGVIEIGAGYAYKSGSEVDVAIGDESFPALHRRLQRLGPGHQDRPGPGGGHEGGQGDGGQGHVQPRHPDH